MKSPQNIKDIDLWIGDKNYNGIPLVRINFNFPCLYTTLTIDNLKQILRLWIEGEEKVYSREKGFLGRELLFKEIKEVFEEGLK